MTKDWISETRNIPTEIARNYCRQITYLNGQKKFYAIGFKNNSGGFELRSPNFKGAASPKDFTFLNTQKWSAVAVFEGFIDFLSSVATGKQLIPELTNFLVLNSLSFFGKARPVMEQHERIYLLLDNDAAIAFMKERSFAHAKAFTKHKRPWKNQLTIHTIKREDAREKLLQKLSNLP